LSKVSADTLAKDKWLSPPCYSIDDEPVWHGYFYTIVLSVVALFAAVADSQYWYQMALVGLRVRTALSSAIYRKSLKLSNKSRKNYSGYTKHVILLVNQSCHS
jgi:hypothetical protein